MLLECPKCSKMFRVRDQNPIPQLKCNSCGTMVGPIGGAPPSTAAGLRCPSCRHVNQENWNYCSNCGSMREP